MTTPAPAHAHRVTFIDVGRAMAVVMMVYGHTIHALLAPSYRAGTVYDIWEFQRGLTSVLFLLLSGFAFSITTSRRWESHTRVSGVLGRRLRRFGVFVLLGYALHFPLTPIVDLLTISDERWRSFTAVDVLQLIGVSLALLQLLVLATKRPRLFMAAVFSLAVLVTGLTPVVWTRDWAGLPVLAAAYLTPATGSLFPLFPWTAYVLIGAGLGQWYGHWGAAHLRVFANRVLLAGGVGLIALSLLARQLPPVPVGDTNALAIPIAVLTRTGAVLVLLSAVAHLSLRLTRLPHLVSVVAFESLLIYAVHLCVVYGSIWNRGLAHYVGPTLAPHQTAVAVAGVLGAMLALAWHWNRLKHARPMVARGVSVGVAVTLVAMLF